MFAIGRFLRLSVAGLRLRIPTEDLPSTRRLVALCGDIAVARAEGERVCGVGGWVWAWVGGGWVCGWGVGGGWGCVSVWVGGGGV